VGGGAFVDVVVGVGGTGERVGGTGVRVGVRAGVLLGSGLGVAVGVRVEVGVIVGSTARSVGVGEDAGEGITLAPRSRAQLITAAATNNAGRSRRRNDDRSLISGPMPTQQDHLPRSALSMAASDYTGGLKRVNGNGIECVTCRPI
jgi:hypothetical protein